MQISKKEREIFTGNKYKEVANLVASKIVHPTTYRPFPVEVIEEAMKNVRFNPKMNEDTKKQAVGCIRTLIKKYKIIRARMLIILSCEIIEIDSLKAFVKERSDPD
jgi:ribosome maturation protein Sdo1